MVTTIPDDKPSVYGSEAYSEEADGEQFISSTTSTTTVIEPMRTTTTTVTTVHSPIRPQRTYTPAPAERPGPPPSAHSRQSRTRSSVSGQSTHSGVSSTDYKGKRPQQPSKKPSSLPGSPGPSRPANANASANVGARPPEPRRLRVPHPNELARPPTTRGDVKTYAVIVGQDVGLFFTWKSVEPLVRNISKCQHKSFKTWAAAYQYYVDHWNSNEIERVPVTEGPYDDPLDPLIQRPQNEGQENLAGLFSEMHT